jgi:hypothetical protein
MLSERDRRIIAALEGEIRQDDPHWARRFTRVHNRLHRPERTPGQRLRSRFAAVAAALLWAALICASATRRDGPWLWTLFGAGFAVLLGFLVRGYVHRLTAYRRARRTTFRVGS